MDDVCGYGRSEVSVIDLKMHKPSNDQKKIRSTGTGTTEREGFEPSIELPLYSISSAAPSTTRPPLQGQIWTDDNVTGCFEPTGMRLRHRITIHWRQKNRTIVHDVPEGEYILRSFEAQGDPIPFSCRNGCCTTCAVRILSGSIDQSEAMGLSKELRGEGYGLLCVARATGPLEVETQDEDEVYDLQFGRFFGKGSITRDIPLEELETWKD